MNLKKFRDCTATAEAADHEADQLKSYIGYYSGELARAKVRYRSAESALERSKFTDVSAVREFKDAEANLDTCLRSEYLVLSRERELRAMARDMRRWATFYSGDVVDFSEGPENPVPPCPQETDAANASR